MTGTRGDKIIFLPYRTETPFSNSYVHVRDSPRRRAANVYSAVSAGTVGVHRALAAKKNVYPEMSIRVPYSRRIVRNV